MFEMGAVIVASCLSLFCLGIVIGVWQQFGRPVGSLAVVLAVGLLLMLWDGVLALFK